MKYSVIRLGLLALLTAESLPAGSVPSSPIDTGFRLLYETRFAEARSQFLTWEKVNPQDPLGHDWEAASYLFEEFYQKGVLTSQFFLDDKKFLGGVPGEPNGPRRIAFLAATARAQNLAKRRLAVNPRDAEALFALTMTTGMLADYASLIERRQLESLKFIRESESYARDLLAVKPDAADAYLALGAANYIIGSLPAHQRFFLWLGGIKGDRQLGMAQLTIVATRGNYLRPFAKILLALVALREGQVGLAHVQLAELTAEFPDNPLFAHELALLDKPMPGRHAGR